LKDDDATLNPTLYRHMIIFRWRLRNPQVETSCPRPKGLPSVFLVLRLQVQRLFRVVTEQLRPPLDSYRPALEFFYALEDLIIS